MHKLSYITREYLAIATSLIYKEFTRLYLSYDFRMYLGGDDAVTTKFGAL